MAVVCTSIKVVTDVDVMTGLCADRLQGSIVRCEIKPKKEELTKTQMNSTNSRAELVYFQNQHRHHCVIACAVFLNMVV